METTETKRGRGRPKGATKGWPLLRVSLICQNPACGKSFEVPPSIAERGRKYCSRSCFWACYIQSAKAGAGRPRAIPVQMVCQNPTCQKVFSVLPGRVQVRPGQNRLYCSNKCGALGRRNTVGEVRRNQDIRRQHAEGIPQVEIAARLGMTRQRVGQIIHRKQEEAE